MVNPMDSVNLFADETGEGPSALVLLHGFGGSHHIWDEVRTFLDPSDHILAYDLPGHGQSLEALGEGAAPQFAKLILADLEQRGVSHAHVVGHSLGGAVAVLMGLFQPQRISRLTLLGPGGFGPEINAALLKDLAHAASAEEIASSLRAMATPDFVPPGSAIRQMAAERAVPGQLDALKVLLSRIVRNGRQGAFTPEQLASLSMPVTLVWGELDPVLPFVQAEGAPASFHLVRQSGCGHMLPLEAPEAMASIITRD
ncbi:dihydrolipoamide acetyltransferase [Nitratireductor aestuarii]|uniref:Dihydrolipoamide acetyltransferase n=1 Tax=Nitratireductor aestuarii TaxID=1735103 RepID=A0A916RVC4_9HYPH|nr:alpha/beta fold hydrolase [Nitratireductor aestuarii]GGA70953.1 dihydrolipoamide acetyltransferase [Nitratireductor aestuarii]